MKRSFDRDRGLERLVGLSREALGDELTPAEDAAGLGRLEMALGERTLRRPGRIRVLWTLGVAGALATAGIVLWLGGFGVGARALTFGVVGGSVSDGGYVRAAGAAETELRFSDGSTMILAPGTRTRVAELGSHGGRVLLETGTARVHVQPRPRAKWSLEAGPYTVRVIGTVFDLRWSGGDEILDLRLEKGSVTVKGPMAGQGLTMEAGQHLVARVRDGQIFLGGTAHGQQPSDEMLAGVPGEEPAREQPAAPLSRPSVEPPTVRRRRVVAPAAREPGAAAVASPSWSRRLAAGDFQGILADAERAGIAETLRTASVGDLAALADAARYARRSELARRALLAARERFPRSHEAGDAAFFLGGIVENDARASGAGTAIDWYDVYLDASPRGAYAAQALGRKMVLVQKLRGGAAARSVAAQYLSRFPDGPYAAQARRLVEPR